MIGGSEHGVRRPVRRPGTPWLLAAGAAAATCWFWLTDPTDPTARSLLPCPFRAITGLDCPGCGATRATWSLVHGRPLDALDYNVLWCIGVGLGIWAWVQMVRGRWPDPRHPFRRRWFAPVGLAVALAFAVVRNLPWAPWSGLAS
ncbi:MAG: DUF2752 domain-containing protein [Acidimicrobiales bacterium]